MNSRLLFSTLALAAFCALTGCGGGAADAPDDGAQVASAGAQGVTAQNVGGISGSGVATQDVGGISGSGKATQDVGGISGSGKATQDVGGISGSGKASVASVHACDLDSAGVTIAGARVNADPTADASSAGWVDVAVATPVRVDLGKLAAGAALPLDLSALPDGTYRQIRLLPSDDAAAASATVPTAAQGGLPLAATITVAGGQASATISGADVCDAVAAVSAGATRVASAD